MKPGHLIRRFFESVRARPLTPGEQRVVAELLESEEQALFWRQQPLDQRHAFEAASVCLAEVPERQDLARAALLHDVGKAHARLGVVGRVLASLAHLGRVPTPSRWRAYLDHARLGADELAALGVEHVIEAFARHHHRAEPPPDVAPDDWALLRRADGE